MSVRHFIRIWDLSKGEIEVILSRALEWKRARKYLNKWEGKILALIFEKASTRTRISFETAMLRLGGNSLFLSKEDLQLARGEPLKDTARVLSRYVNVVVLRTYAQETIEEFAKFSTIPVINGLSNQFHPCQVLSDIMTIIEKGKDLYRDKIVWIGDGNNVAQSWIEASAILGFPLTICCPKGFEPSKDLIKEAKERFGAQIEINHDPQTALKEAQVINTDVWISMGQELETEKRRRAFKGYTLDTKLLSYAHPSAIVLHCLPAHRGEEISEEVLEGPQAVVWDQAENKMWLHMALLDFLLEQR
ncbi:MAG: ornithine carbamoyltransferase [Caldimicrobium sp.]|nr:ornithine carbamoyltransferase [Caldimicrobium sp.]MCX7873355.1 ornithine carbamoyltransferase [Caldimicrobium sp.]MDW8093407.1 ornithine carbamoyltransferase [Caldimicrobium sp.]